ncbi:MAG: hypothetical protein RLZZ519_1980 [Bacteroidota bacterium]|jgi:hypothetical protein
MSAFAVWLDDADKGTFGFIRRVFQSEFLEQNSGLLGDMKAWVPFLVFLAIVTYLTKPGAGVFSLFFGLASFILSFQAAMLLAKIIFQPSPVQLEYLHHGLELPAYGRALGVSLPDWGIAALAGVFHFARLRLKQIQGPNLMAMWALVFLFALLRVYAGLSWPHLSAFWSDGSCFSCCAASNCSPRRCQLKVLANRRMIFASSPAFSMISF